jgi:hypothetical protein
MELNLYLIEQRETGISAEIEAGNFKSALKKLGWEGKQCFWKVISKPKTWPCVPLRSLKGSDNGPLFKKGGN